METVLLSPANASFLGIPTVIFSLLFPVIGVSIFTYIIARRLAPLVRSQPDLRFDRIPERILAFLKFGVGQYKQPRYRLAGVVHILIFAGFMIISLHSITLVLAGIKANYTLPFLTGISGHLYAFLKEIAATLVLIACVIAIVRRGYFKPARYAVPAKYGKDHTAEAIFVLCMISGLMISDALFEGSEIAAQAKAGWDPEFMAPGTLGWMSAKMLTGLSIPALQKIHLIFYYVHELIFFTFLNFLPLGKHFHVITSLPNVFLMKLNKGSVKPVKWGVDESKLDELESFGVKTFEDFTWKNMLDFYTCADCGRCSDRCPANRVGRPLSPRFISIKCRDYAFEKYPLQGDITRKHEPLIGSILEEDEIWSCTTCGACEEECPITIEYIDKIVDLRRGMVDEGMVPQSLQKPLSALEKRGNPYGKMEKKRAEWTKDLPETVAVKMLDEGDTADTLFFVDSITSYDDNIQSIGKATARVLAAAGVDFGILGKMEKDSGHEVRRFGEEMLFQDLKEQNSEAILESGASRIVTADPHAYNALRKDYNGLPPVYHISEIIAEAVASGRIQLSKAEEDGQIYTYHDPCYLGRHNGLYDIPRTVLDAIPGLTRVEMEGNCRDRSFCCGGGGLMLFYEPIEEQRMGQIRVEMAAQSGANVIVTACPFCKVNMEDAIKTSGLEGKMEAIDLVELIDRHLVV